MPIDPIENLWINAQRSSSPDGIRISKAEADQILSAITGDGKITNAEVAVVDQILKQIAATAVTSSADAELDAIDFGMSGRKVVDSSGAGTTLADIAGMKREMEALDSNQKASSFDAAQKAHLLETATSIRHQIEVARRVPTIVDNLSRTLLWDFFVIRDSEAKAALDQVEAAGSYANVVIAHLAVKDGGKFLRRLVDQLPADGKRRLNKVMQGLDTKTKSTAYRVVGRDLWGQMERA